MRQKLVSLASHGAQCVGEPASGVQGVDVDTHTHTTWICAPSRPCSRTPTSRPVLTRNTAATYPDQSASRASGAATQRVPEKRACPIERRLPCKAKGHVSPVLVRPRVARFHQSGGTRPRYCPQSPGIKQYKQGRARVAAQSPCRAFGLLWWPECGDGALATQATHQMPRHPTGVQQSPAVSQHLCGVLKLLYDRVRRAAT